MREAREFLKKIVNFYNQSLQSARVAELKRYMQSTHEI
jgi:hypothetical protein